MLARETRVRRGPVPRELAGTAVGEDDDRLEGDCFLLRARAGISLFYQRGHGVTVEHPDDTDPRDVALLLHGVLYSAIAAINGLMPLHASAVAHAGRVYAFTGAPGAGKSTLAAGLGREGFPLFCDDTLLLDISGADIVCLPGHKRLKLWPEGVALARATAREHVASHYPKHFAHPVAGLVDEPLPLAELLFLEAGNHPALLPVAPGERLARLQDDHYTARLFAKAGGLSRAERFKQLAAIARRMPMRRFARPFDPAAFDRGLAFIADHIRSGDSA